MGRIDELSFESPSIKSPTIESRSTQSVEEITPPGLPALAMAGTFPTGDGDKSHWLGLDKPAHEPKLVREGSKKYRCTYPGCGKIFSRFRDAWIHRCEAHNSSWRT
ncbi:hypothetical protein HK405_005686, partial [Cladochytrium tenue]